MNTVHRLLEDDYHAGDVESSAGAVGSAVLLDAPCLAGAMVFNQQVEQKLKRLFYGEEEDHRHKQMFSDIYVCSDREEDNSWQAMVNSRMSTVWACLACMVYPSLICPTTCWLRRRAVAKADIRTETCADTAQVVACCWPCALVQMEEELQGDAHEFKKMQRSLASTRMVL
jgi:hypothetical protein